MLKSSKLSERFKKSNVDVKDDIPANQVKNDEEIEFSIEVEDDLKNNLLKKIQSTPVWFDYPDKKQKELVLGFLENRLNFLDVECSLEQKNNLVEKLYSFVSGFGPLDYLLSKDNVTAVFVNEKKNVLIEIDGKILNTEISLSDEQLNLILNNIFKMCSQKFDNTRSIWNLRFQKFHINIVYPPVCDGGISLSVRKLYDADINILFEKNIMTKEIFDFILSMILDNKNVVISGDINAGKTFVMNVLLNSISSLKRSILVQEYPQFICTSDNVMKFIVPDSDREKQLLKSSILGFSPECVFTDLNMPDCTLAERKGYVSSLRASSIDSAFSKLISNFMSKMNLAEKYAKTSVLTNFDYIVQINKFKDGTSKVTSVVELKPARTTALSIKSVAKLVDGHYVTEIPQPLTSLKSESFLAQSNSMYSRFYHQD